MSLDQQKMIFGCLLLIVNATIAITIAVGHVEEKTSFGLGMILGSFNTLSGGFAQWAFSTKGGDKDEYSRSDSKNGRIL